MKKLFLSLIAVAVGTLGSYAQSDLVATLSHNSTLTTYYGADALSEAYTAASAGDVITLSSGTFNAVDMEKAITVRGAGMMPMTNNGNVSTQLTGGMTINVPSNATSVLTLEGVQVLGDVQIYGENLAPVNIIKSKFDKDINAWGVSMNALSCIFAGRLVGKINVNYTANKNTTLNCMNCIMAWAETDDVSWQTSEIAKILATNCIVNCGNSPRNCSFTNCIIIAYEYQKSHNPLNGTCSAQNCIGIDPDNYTPNLFENIISSSNSMVSGYGATAYASVFKTLTGLPAVTTETYELTPTAAATYLGDDGTQVGIYGGTNPFDPTPTNTQISGFTVNTSTNNGSLSVTINVE